MNKTATMNPDSFWKLWPFAMLLFIPLLQWAPYWFPVPIDVVSASAAVGYSTKYAYLLIVLFAVICIVAGWVTTKNKNANNNVDNDGPEPFTTNDSIPEVQKWLERSLAVILPWIVYCPIFLARYGPFVEDSYFLSLLNRMHSGQIPYADFETLYSPLLVYLPYYWSQLVGHSMAGYYAYICLLESAQYLLIVVLLQSYLPNTKHRFWAIVLISGMVFNTLLSPTWNGLRRLFPVFIILYASRSTESTKRSLICGCLLGLMMAYSHDYGAACAIGLAAGYLTSYANSRSLSVLIRLVTLSMTSLCIWIFTTWIILGSNTVTYFQHSIYSMSRYSQEGGFQFYWTLNSLAVFSLITGSALLIGAGTTRKQHFSTADLFLVSAFVYAIIALKSGMNRCDMWHLVPPTFGLVLWWILPLNKNRFTPPRSITTAMTFIVAIISATYLIALAPTGQHYVTGLLNGAKDVLSGAKPSFSANTRIPSILAENSSPEPAQVDLAKYLNEPTRRDRPIFFYSRLWALDKALGVVPETYPTDDFLLSESAGIELGKYVSGPSKPLVVLDGPLFEAIYTDDTLLANMAKLEDSGYFDRRNNSTPMKKILRLTSTVHYIAAPIENVEKEKRWMRTVGKELKISHRKVAQFGRYVVLEPTDANIQYN